MRARLRFVIGALGVAALAAGCDGSGPAGPDGGPIASLDLVARAEHPARLPTALRPSTLVAEVRNTAGALVRDTTLQVQPGQELELDIPVAAVTENQVFLVQLFLRSGDATEVYRSERTTAVARDPELPAEPTEVILLYSGPGAGADHLEIVPGESYVLLGASTTLEARAVSAGGAGQETVPVDWVSLNPGVLEVADPVSGLLRAGDRRGVARVVAELGPMGFVDTATVFVNPPAADLRRAGGHNQDGEAGGRLSNPVRVRVLGTDGLPVGGVAVRFEPGSGGQVSPEVAVTAGDGRAEVEWTLGPQLGDQEMVARVQDDPSLTVTFGADATAAALASLTITPTELSFDALTASSTLQVSGRDIFDNPVNPSGVSWSSSNASVATVSSGGRVTAVGNGEAEIRATASGVTSPPVRVVVDQVAVGARIEPASGWALPQGDTLDFQGVALDRRDRPVEGAAFEWSSSNTDVLTVNASGEGVGRETGNATVTARLVGASSISATSSGTVGPAGLHQLVVTPGSVSFDALTATRALTVEGRDRFGNPVELGSVAWASSNTNVARVSTSGVVRAVGEGATTVTATSEGVVSNAVPVEVDQVPVAIEIDPSSGWEVPQGEEIRFSAAAVDRLGSPLGGASFQWSSSNDGILDVGSDGTGVGGARGSVTVTASLVGGSLSASSQGSVVYGSLVELIVSPGSVDFDALGATRQISLEGRDRFGNTVPVSGASWSSSDSEVVGVSGSGLLTATGNGNATVRATAGGVQSDRIEVAVEQIGVGMSVRPPSGWVVFEREDMQFEATVFDRLGNALEDPHLHWESSNTSVLTIDRHDGDARAREGGVVTVSVVLNGNESVSGSTTGVVLDR